MAGHVGFRLLVRWRRPVRVLLRLGQPRAVYCQVALLQLLLCCAASAGAAACTGRLVLLSASALTGRLFCNGALGGACTLLGAVC